MSVQELEVVEQDPTNFVGVNSRRRIWICNLRMIPAKLSYFGMSGMVGSYGYFTNIFLRDVGLMVEETGLISGLTYAVLALFSPLWGLLIDYTGRRKLIFATLFTSMAICVFLLPFVAFWIEPINRNSTTISSNTTTTTPPSRHLSFSSTMFFAMLLLEIIGKVFTSPLQAMIDAACMNIITTKETKATFGDQRLYGGLAFGSMAFVSGEFIDHFTSYFEEIHMSKYTTAFCVFLPMAAFTFISCMALLNQMDLTVTADEKKEEGNQKHLVLTTFSNTRNIIFLLTCFMVGLSNMTLVGYLYMLMKDKMSSSKSMMGLSSLVQSIVQVLIFPFADRIIKFVGGTINAISISLLSYFIRFLVNSYITNPLAAVVTQSFHATCFSLFWAAAVVHTERIAPKGIYVTMFTIVNGVYYGIGGIVANLLGGIVYGKYGGQILFRGMSVLNLTWALVVLIFFHGRTINAYITGKRCDTNNAKITPESTT